MRKYRRHYKIKRRKKRSILKNRFFWLVIFCLATFGGVFYLTSFSRFFEVQGAEISGNQKVSSENLENILKKETEQKILFFATKSIFLANLNEIKEKILKDFPQIAKVNIKRSFPNKISIQVEERTVAAIFCQSQQTEKCFLIDGEGIIIDYVVLLSSENLKLARIIGEAKSSDLGVKVIEKKYLTFILETQEKLKENQKIEIKEFIPSGKKLIVLTSEGWQIFFDSSGDTLEQILNLDTLLKEKIPPENRGNLEYIDLRFGNKVYLKPR